MLSQTDKEENQEATRIKERFPLVSLYSFLQDGGFFDMTTGNFRTYYIYICFLHLWIG
jgi:hypothetical protein